MWERLRTPAHPVKLPQTQLIYVSASEEGSHRVLQSQEVMTRSVWCGGYPGRATKSAPGAHPLFEDTYGDFHPCDSFLGNYHGLQGP